MTNENLTACGEHERLIDYAYDELDAGERARFETHLASCGECRDALAGIRSVRAQLAGWQVPERGFGFTIAPGGTAAATRPARPWWAPGALAAAAVVLLAAGAAIANLEITYGRDGISVRTGWSRAQSPAVTTSAARPEPSPAPAAPRAAANDAPLPVGAGGTPWRDDLAALERRLRGEFRSIPTASPASGRRVSAASTADSDELLRRVQELIEQSELRQRRELALRVAQVVRDFDTQRQNDLVRIQQGLGQIEGSTAADRQVLNYLVRASQRR